MHLLHLRMYVHTVVAPDVLLKYRLAEMINGNWSECSKCLEVSDHEVCDIQSWYTACVERAYTVLDIFHEQCGKKSRNFVEEIEKRLSCLPKFPELQRALNSTDHLCVRKLCEFLQQSVQVLNTNYMHHCIISKHYSPCINIVPHTSLAGLTQAQLPSQPPCSHNFIRKVVQSMSSFSCPPKITWGDS